ncbi:MAG: alkaline phosphatase D family protein [Microscillaceae bacterium]|nr:alkaline phosphatase D family protein [Microscillaceae bacterium]
MHQIPFTLRKALFCALFLVLSLPNFAQTPFNHGVASGDPLSDRVIIWTRVTPETPNAAPFEVTWKVAMDYGLSNVVKSGKFSTGADRDYTVKVDVDGLMPGKTYYYAFEALGKQSIVGRTKTTPADQVDHLRFAVVSCNNYQDGYFNAFARIAERTDLDAVIHLGDYIYEYSATGDDRFGRSVLLNAGLRLHEPDKEIVSLEDYRTRYAQYRLDSNLRKAHQVHPFITIWDDHESTNNSYRDGAENHDPDQGEGDWEVRKSVSKQAYSEWMPIRGDLNERVLYRTIHYGNLMDLILLDTRLEGRDITDGANNDTIVNVANPGLYADDRQVLGQAQEQWLFEQLQNSTAKWKVIGNQIVFADFNTWWADANGDPIAGQDLFLDFWDGYPKAKDRVINFLANKQIDNVVIITGDFHSSIASDVALEPSVLAGVNENIAKFRVAPFPVTPTYNPQTGVGSVAVEFATPGISSQNFDEFFIESGLDPATALNIALGFQFQVNNPLPANAGPVAGINPNPHIKYNDLIRQGYLVLDVKPDRAQSNWYFTTDVLNPAAGEVFGAAWGTNDGDNFLTKGVENPSKKTITSFTLIDAQNDQPIPAFDPIKEGAVINLSELPVSRQLNIRANTSKNVGSIFFKLQKENNPSFFNIENVAPYALFNDNNANYLSWRPAPPQNGDVFTLTATAYDQPGGQGNADEPTVLKFSFNDIGDAPSLSRLVLINADTDKEIGELKDGQVVNLAEIGTNHLSVMAVTQPSPTGSVIFNLNGPVSQQTIENLLPYALFGDMPGRDFNGKPFGTGEYTLETIAYNANNGQGAASEPLNVKFEVVTSAVNVELKVLANPSDKKLLEVTSDEEVGIGTMKVISATGKVIAILEIHGNLNEQVNLPQKGMYFLKIKTDKIDQTKRFIAY